MIYKVNDETFDNIDDVIEYCIEPDYHRDDDYFKEWVDEEYGSIDIGGKTYYAYDILRDDDYNYSDVLDAYCECENDNDEGNARYALRNASDGEEVYIQAYTVKCYESGDYDGDGEFALQSLKASLLAQQAMAHAQAVVEKEKEKELMDMFQVIK